MIKLINSILIVLVLNVLTGCSTKKDTTKLHSAFQTNGASLIREYKDAYSITLAKYYKMLNVRNPRYTKKKYSRKVFKDIDNYTNNTRFPLLKKKKNSTYKDYLKIAFSKKHVKYRNDYLIAGMYKMYFWAYEMDREHTITALQYDAKKLQKLYKMLQVIEYKVSTYKLKRGTYMYLTWQRGWQIDYLRKSASKKGNYKKYSKKELMYSSNMDFRVMMHGMQNSVKHSLRYLGDEGVNLSIQAIKSLSMLI